MVKLQVPSKVNLFVGYVGARKKWQSLRQRKIDVQYLFVIVKDSLGSDLKKPSGGEDYENLIRQQRTSHVLGKVTKHI